MEEVKKGKMYFAREKNKGEGSEEQCSMLL
jgi:hypothetical protein